MSAHSTLPRQPPPPLLLTRQDTKHLLALIHQRSRIDFRLYDPDLVDRRIASRVCRRGFTTVAEYLLALDGDPREFERLMRSLLVSVTSSLRQPAAAGNGNGESAAISEPLSWSAGGRGPWSHDESVEHHMGAALMVFDIGGRLRVCNAAALPITGRTRPPIGQHISKVMLGAGWPEVLERVQTAIAEGTAADVRYTSAERSWDVRVSAWRSGDRQVRGAILVMHDVTPLIEANARLLQAEAQLLLRNAQQQATLDSIEANVALIDRGGVVVAVNSAWQAFARQNGLASDDGAIGSNYLHVCDRAVGSGVDGASEVAGGIRDVLHGRTDRFVIEYPCDSPAEQRWFRCYVTPARHTLSPGAVVLHMDITESRRLLERVHRQATALETAANAICITDIDNVLDWANPAFAELTGLRTGDRVDTSAVSLVTQSGLRFAEVLRECALTGEPWRGETVVHRTGGDVVYAQQTTSPIPHTFGHVRHFVTILEDITGHKQAHRSILYMAEHDQLTGLLNRKSFNERLSVRLLAHGEGGGRLAVAFIDLDHFKTINDTLGHHAGDLLLAAVAQRLRQRVRSADAVARLGGDEFMLYIDNWSNLDDVRPAFARIFDAFREPFELDGHTVAISASIGVTVFPDDGRTVERLVRNADMAMYRVKVQGRRGVHVFDNSLEDEANERQTLQAQLQRALALGELELFLQPQFDLSTGRMAGAECLLRTPHSSLSTVPMARLIALAEESGMIVPVGEWVIVNSIRAAARLARAGIDVPVAINLSPLQFHRQDVCRLLVQHVCEQGLRPQAVKLEITEAVLLEHSQRVRDMLDGLHGAGFALCLDDFGTGYSSLSSLQQFPLHELKIDARFVRNLEQAPGDRAIVEGIVRLAESLRIEVVAEGVETQGQHDILRATTCRLGQGFHLGRPAPIEEFVERFAPH